MEKVLILPFTESKIPEAVELLGKAYVNNPLHLAVFGKNNVRSNTLFMGMGFKNMVGRTFTAESGGKIVGVIRITKHPLLESAQTPRAPLTPEFLGISESALAKIPEWFAAWEKVHPADGHYHLGPIGVLPELQNQGIGSKMMEHCCKILDREGEAGYLETETIENVRFYTRFGFKVVHEQKVIGLPNWFMKRLSRTK